MILQGTLRAWLQSRGLHCVGNGSEDSNADFTLQYDAVVLGSGAGGGVTAAVLAKAGKAIQRMTCEQQRAFYCNMQLW